MHRFSQLYQALDETNKTSEKVQALRKYLRQAPPVDACWAVFFLIGRRLPRPIQTQLLRKWAAEVAHIDAWLFDECYDHVGDLAETIALIMPPASKLEDALPLHRLVVEHLRPLRDLPEEKQRSAVLQLWASLSPYDLFVLGKLLTGGFRVGVSSKLVHRALSEEFGIKQTTVAHRLMGEWSPSEDLFLRWINPDENETSPSTPYPFFLANPLTSPASDLGEVRQWSAEWKWDGIRAQLIRRQNKTYLWSRGEELITEQFPEIAKLAEQLPNGTAIDGEILAWDQARHRPADFNQLQRRLGRKKFSNKLLQDVPAVLLGFDLLEFEGNDIRERPLWERRQMLESVIAGLQAKTQAVSGGYLFDQLKSTDLSLRLSPRLETDSWADLQSHRSQSKTQNAEGLMLKRFDSSYQVGRPIGDWWKWKIDPITIDAVLIYAQRGHGRRASLYSDYTFALWDAGELVAFAKAYSGLTDAEIREVDRFVRNNTLERFGPVRTVNPELVFELAFEKIQRSTRHKSGIAVRFPRILRWRRDKQPAEADSLERILAVIDPPQS